MIVAHAAHWYHSVLYAAPVGVVVVALWLSGRAADRRADGDEPPAPPGS